MQKEKIAILIRRFEAMRNQKEAVFLDEDAFEQIIDYYILKDEYENALAAATLGCREHRYSTELQWLKAELHSELHQFRDCFDAAQTAENLGLRTVELYILKADAALGFGDKKSAQTELHIALDKASDDQEFAAIYVGIANIYEAQNDYSKVIDTLRLALQHNPNDEDAFARIAHAADETDRHEDALTIFQAVADANPYSAKAWFYLAKMQAQLSDTLAAVSAYEYAIVINESFIDAYCALAETFFEEGLYEKSIEVLQNANAESPEPNAEIQYLLGCNYENLEKTAKAKAYYSEAIKINQAHNQARFALGSLFANDQNWQAAIRQFDRCVQICDFNPEYWFATGDAHAHLDNVEQANFYFKNGLKHTNDIDYWLTYINFLLAYDKIEEALNIIEEAETLCAVDARLQYAKVAALLLAKKRKSALLLLQITLAENHNEHRYLLDIFPELVKDYEILRMLKR